MVVSKHYDSEGERQDTGAMAASVINICIGKRTAGMHEEAVEMGGRVVRRVED